MKCFLNTLFVCAVSFSAASAFAAPIAVAGVNKDSNGVTLRMNPGVLRLEVYSPCIIRVTYAAQDQLPKSASLAVIAQPQRVKWKLIEGKDEIILRTDEIQASVNRATGAVSFFDSAGRVLLREVAGGRKIQRATIAGDAVTSCAQSFESASDEGIYGLGQHQRGAWNYAPVTTQRQARASQHGRRDSSDDLKQRIHDSLGQSRRDHRFHQRRGRYGHGQKVLRWSSECGKAIDYYFCYGDGTIDTAMKAYRHLTGEAPLMPKWELGFWQCKERYASQEELLGVAKSVREMKVPVDGIIQDWQYWPPGNNTWGSHQFDPARYPGPGGHVQGIAR